MLVGPPGVGKTTSVEDFVFKKNVPYITIQANRDTTDMELIGHDVLKSDGHGGTITQFEPGELPRAISKANKYGTAVLLVDEDECSPNTSLLLTRCSMEGVPSSGQSASGH